MNDTQELRRARRNRMWGGLALMAVTTIAVMAVGKWVPATWGMVWAAAGAGAAGLIALAALYAPVHRRPWGHWVSASLVAAFLLAGPLFARSPAAWVEGQRDFAWLLPWWIFTTSSALERPAASRGVCADSRFGGWWMVGASALFTTILAVASWISGRS